MTVAGFLDLGTAISGTTVVVPPSGTNYAPQPIDFDSFQGGVQLSNVNCVFGPVSGSWGTLTVFGVTDGSGNAIVPPGTLQSPFTPLNGQLVCVPPGDISLVVGAQFAAGPGTFVPNLSGPTASGSIALTSGAYAAVVASGARNTLQVQNLASGDVVKLRIGDATQPPSGAVPTTVLGPYGTWPPLGGGFTTTDAVWATCGAASGTTASWITG